MPRRKYDSQPFASVDPNRVLDGTPHKPIVYFLRIGDAIKIGTSTNMKSRLITLSLLPRNIVLLVPGGRETEHIYHKQFKRLLIQGEWFKYTGELRTFLTSYVNHVVKRATELTTSDFTDSVTNVYANGAGADDEPAMTLREMCDAGIIPMRYSAATRARSRAGNAFPAGERSPVGTLYAPADVRAWHNSRNGKRK